MRKASIVCCLIFQWVAIHSRAEVDPIPAWSATWTNVARIMTAAPDGSVYVIGPEFGFGLYGYATFYEIAVVANFTASGVQTSSLGGVVAPPPSTIRLNWSARAAAVSPENVLYVGFSTFLHWLPYRPGEESQRSGVEVQKLPSSALFNSTSFTNCVDLFWEGDGYTVVSVLNNIAQLQHIGAHNIPWYNGPGYSFTPYTIKTVPDVTGRYLFAATNTLGLVAQSRTGQILWERPYQGGAAESIRVIAAGLDGIYLAGVRSNGSSTFGSHQFTASAGSFLVRTDFDGQVLWAKGLPGIEIKVMEIDPAGGVFIGGKLSNGGGPVLRAYGAAGDLNWEAASIGVAGELVQDLSVAGNRLAVWVRTDDPASISTIRAYNLNFTTQQGPVLRVSKSVLGEGDAFDLTVATTMTAPVSFHWFRNQVAVENGAPVLAKTEALAIDSGSYFVIASNFTGMKTSAPVSITVTQYQLFGTLKRETSEFVAHWPMEPKLHLQASSMAGGAFSNVVGLPASNGLNGRFEMTIPLSDQRRFFRLVRVGN